MKQKTCTKKPKSKQYTADNSQPDFFQLFWLPQKKKKKISHRKRYLYFNQNTTFKTQSISDL